MWKNVAVAVVVTGALSLGSVGAAVAAPAPGSGSGSTAPKAGAQFNCANASKALGRIDDAEGKINGRLAKLTAAEQTATKNGHTKLAQRIEKRIHRLHKLENRATKVSGKIEAKCPGAQSTPKAGTAGSSTGAALT